MVFMKGGGCVVLRGDGLAGLDLNPGVRRLFALYEELGWPLVLVGGCVRDACLGRPIQDYDFASGVPAPELKRKLDELGWPYYLAGYEHGTIVVGVEGQWYELTAWRREAGYSDGRRPDAVVFTPVLEEDLLRRDFTVNAMAWSPRTGLVDPYGGLADLEAGVLRAVGVAGRRFHEDALRLLRALRFALKLQLRMEDQTASAWREALPLVQRLAGERMWAEWQQLVCLVRLGGTAETENGERLTAAWQTCWELGGTPDWKQLPRLPEDAILRASALIMSENRPVEAASRLAARARLSRQEQLRLSRLVAGASDPELPALLERVDSLSDGEFLRWLEAWEDDLLRDQLLQLLAWKQPGLAVSCAAAGERSRRLKPLYPLSVQDLALGGEEVARLAGLRPSPELGRLLRFLLESVWDGACTNHADALTKRIADRQAEQAL